MKNNYGFHFVLDGPSCVQEPNDDCLINKLVKLTKSVKTSFEETSKVEGHGVQSSYQQHNDMWDLQTVLKGPVQPLNEAAKEPAAAVGSCGSQLGIWVSVRHMKRKMTEHFNGAGQMAPFHHCAVTFKEWFLKAYLAIPERRGTNKILSVLQNISILKRRMN